MRTVELVDFFLLCFTIGTHTFQSISENIINTTLPQSDPLGECKKTLTPGGYNMQIFLYTFWGQRRREYMMIML